MTRPDGIVEAETQTASACNCFAKIRIRATFTQSRDRTRALGDTRRRIERRASFFIFLRHNALKSHESDE
jgi:hypothetical protein